MVLADCSLGILSILISLLNAVLNIFCGLLLKINLALALLVSLTVVLTLPPNTMFTLLDAAWPALLPKLTLGMLRLVLILMGDDDLEGMLSFDVGELIFNTRDVDDCFI